MHICFIYNEYPEETNNGGIATYQYNMAKALYKKKNDVTVIASSFKEEKDYIENGIRVIRLKNNLFGTISEQLDYRRRVFETIDRVNKNKKIDIIETPDMGAEALFCIRNKKIPVIVKLHTSYKLWSELNGQLLDDTMHKQMIEWELEQLNGANCIISCSSLLKKIIKKDIKNKKIDIIPNPIDTEKFYPMNIRDKSNKIVFCGSLEGRKGILIFIKSIPYVIKGLENEVEFEIIGKDSLCKSGTKMSERIFKELPKEYHRNIKLYGFLGSKELNEIFNKSAIGVIPSLFDNLPYVAMEELLTELPIVISSNTGITKDLTRSKSAIGFKNGDYKQLANKIIKLYKNPLKAHMIAENGRNTVLKKYSSDEIADIMLKKYKQVIKKFNYEGE